jgi:hypothetical protein
MHLTVETYRRRRVNCRIGLRAGKPGLIVGIRLGWKREGEFFMDCPKLHATAQLLS